MTAERFSYREQVELDIERGRLRLVGSANDRVAVPADALAALLRDAGEESARRFGRSLGQVAGARVRQRLPDPTAASIDAVVDHLGGELAVHGLGSLAMERWNRALIVTVEGPAWGQAGDSALAELLAACFEAVFAGHELEVVALGRNGDQARFAVLGAAAAGKVRTWLASGDSWGVIVERLHGGQE